MRRLQRSPLLVLLIAAFAVPQSARGQGAVGGVYIDADGLLRETSALTEDGQLDKLRAAAGGLTPSREVAAPSMLRKVSLKRLEDAVARHHAAGEPLPPDVRCLAGLTGVRYVLFYPESEDVLLAGPAEGWRQLPTGEVIGERSGRPVLQLDDLLVALHYAFREEADAFIGCSIEPTPEGLKRHATLLRQLGGRMDRSRAAEILGGIEQAMGPQAVKVYGVEPSTRFALKLVAADYRLKRLALGHDPSPVPEVVNYLDLLAQRPFAPAAAQPQHRWWFVAAYDTIRHTPDGLAYELEGQSVRVATARALTGESDKKPLKPSPLAEKFADDFTQHFEAIAARQPVFAELQNLVALAVAAELIAQKRDAATRGDDGATHWLPRHVLDEKQCPVEPATAPRQVPSLANFRIVGGRHWIISISGGVEVSPGEIVGDALRPATPRHNLAETLSDSAPNDDSRWWWD